MVNPFCNSSDVEILKEAFPTLNISVIEDNLLAANGDVNRAFELLLALTDPAHSSTNAPPLPTRRTSHKVDSYFCHINLGNIELSDLFCYTFYTGLSCLFTTRRDDTSHTRCA